VVPTTLILIGLVAGLVLEVLVYRLVSRGGLLAVPNARSSHTEPTPTMGGVVIVLVVLAYCIHLALIDPMLGWPLFAALTALAVIGLWDDLQGLSARLRFVVHVVAAAIVVWFLFPQMALWAVLLCVGGLVWLINLYNFMDGIDGYAGGQCLLYALAVQLIVGGVPGWSGDMLWLLSGVTLAFLTFNWPPAKIFMGDVASGFLGLLLGVLALYLNHAQHLPLVASLILLAGFWFDASYTLCVRMLTGQAFTQAHRLHMYQLLAQRIGHLWTTMALLLFGTTVLMPLAVWATRDPTWQWVALGAAVIPLAVACVWLGAGKDPRPLDTEPV